MRPTDRIRTVRLERAATTTGTVFFLRVGAE
jgi:hypothetical protein